MNLQNSVDSLNRLSLDWNPDIEVERAKVLAKALRMHPAVIVLPGWEIEAA